MKFFVLPIMALLAVPAVDAATVKQPLHATVVAPGAQGKASFALGGNASRGRRGKLKVLARHLPPARSFGISVAGVRIGTLTTNGRGTGAASFSNPQKITPSCDDCRGRCGRDRRRPSSRAPGWGGSHARPTRGEPTVKQSMA